MINLFSNNRDVFQFIEDVVLIRVSYSLAMGHKKLTNKLMHVGIVGAFLTGLVAAVIGTILGVIPATLSVLTNPGAANDEATYPDCALIGSYDSSIIKPYWIIQSKMLVVQILSRMICYISYLLSISLLNSSVGYPWSITGTGD